MLYSFHRCLPISLNLRYILFHYFINVIINNNIDFNGKKNEYSRKGKIRWSNSQKKTTVDNMLKANTLSILKKHRSMQSLFKTSTLNHLEKVKAEGPESMSNRFFWRILPTVLSFITIDIIQPTEELEAPKNIQILNITPPCPCTFCCSIYEFCCTYMAPQVHSHQGVSFWIFGKMHIFLIMPLISIL